MLSLGRLDYTPEPWTPVDSLAWLKAMAWDLRGNMDDEIDRVLALADALSAEQVARPLPGVPLRPATQPIVEQGAVVDGRLRAGRDRRRHPQPAAPGVHRRPSVGAARRLHADVARMPALLGPATASAATPGSSTARTPRRQAAARQRPAPRRQLPGRLVPDGPALHDGLGGLPARRRRLHVLRRARRGDRPQRRRRLGLHQPRPRRHRPLPGEGRAATAGGTTAGWRPLHDRARRRSRSPAATTSTITVRSTKHGPLLSDVSDELADVGGEAPVAGRPPPRRQRVRRRAEWTALQPAADRRRDPRARPGPTGTRSGGRGRFAVPAQNLVYADTEGHIGYQAPGQVPIRKSGNDGRLPSAGWLPENDWSGTTTCRSPLRRSLEPDMVDREPAGDRPAYPSPPTTGTTATARSGSATSSRPRATCRSTR